MTYKPKSKQTVVNSKDIVLSQHHFWTASKTWAFRNCFCLHVLQTDNGTFSLTSMKNLKDGRGKGNHSSRPTFKRIPSRVLHVVIVILLSIDQSNITTSCITKTYMLFYSIYTKRRLTIFSFLQHQNLKLTFETNNIEETGMSKSNTCLPINMALRNPNVGTALARGCGGAHACRGNIRTGKLRRNDLGRKCKNKPHKIENKPHL